MKAPIVIFISLCVCAAGTAIWMQGSMDFPSPEPSIEVGERGAISQPKNGAEALPENVENGEDTGLKQTEAGSKNPTTTGPQNIKNLGTANPTAGKGPQLKGPQIARLNSGKGPAAAPGKTRDLPFGKGGFHDKQAQGAVGLAQAKRNFLESPEARSARDRLDSAERDRRADDWDPDKDFQDSSETSNQDDDSEDGENSEGDEEDDENKEGDEEEEKLPASWVILLLDAGDEPVVGAPLALDPLAEVEAQVFTDFEGKARFSNITPEQAWSLYHLDPVEGAQLLDTHQFESEEEYYNTYRLDSGGNEKGSLTLRIQSSEGKEIREGWVSSVVFLSEGEIPALLEGGAFIQAVEPGQSISFSDVPPHEEISLSFISGGFESVFLQSVTLKSGEDKNLGTLRLQNDTLLSSYLSGIIRGENFEPMVGLNLELRSGQQTPKVATTDENGFFSFTGLNRFQRYTMIGREGDTHSEILIDDLLVDELEVYRELNWIGLKSVLFSINSRSQAIDGAHLTLTPTASEVEGIDTPRILDKISDTKGKVNIEGLFPEQTYELNLSHPFYETITLKDWSLGERTEVDLTMEALRGVKVKLTGPNVQLGLVVRAWVGVERDGFIVPDYQPGNEYDEEITEDELLFATPPEERFWIYVGGLPEPWGNGLHGPYTPGKDEFIEIELQEVEALMVDISQSQTTDGNIGTWNLLVYALAGGTEAFTQIKGQQITGGYMYGRPMYLHPGDYRLRVQSDWHEKLLEDIKWDGVRRVESFALTPRPAPTSTEGWVRSFYISDTFPLILSGRNPHHEEMSYGFNVDFLSHLGGERRYQARHLGEHLSLDRKRSIVWRQFDLGSEQWYLDLKDSIFPGDAGDYVTTYVQFQVQSPSTRDAVLALNSDDGFKAWVNGELKGQINIGRPIYQSSRVRRGDQDLIPIRLNAGMNQLNFKVTNSFGFFQFAARILDPTTEAPFEDVQYYPEPLVKSKAQ